ncbi:transposase [Lysinibacillus sphaericus OT4b.31]|uniref:Transposase n=1 Tax=Lysinibacillus sphaericus OT4b.31 TaxID=1285586 RepID=R7ZGG4_LYSSH|nr:transposase [Lysinibacillus sphaericus OT4b.31]
MEETDHLRHRSDMKQIYACQKETIECVCGDEIEKHGYVGQP